MRIQINGEQREFPSQSLTIQKLIEILSLPPQRIAVEVNKTIVRRSDWDLTDLKEGDQIEIVHFVGGGTQSAESSRQTARMIRTTSVVGLEGVKSGFIQ